MKNKNAKRVLKLFLLPDYEKEEEYLSEMHRKGWKFVKVSFIKYTFEKCIPENVVYKIDFSPNKNHSSYVNMFGDYGWEYIQDLNDFSYFRKNAAGVPEADLEIFSNEASRLEMMRKIITTKLLPLLCIFLCCVLLNFVKIFNGGFPNGPVRYGLAVIFCILFGLYGYIFTYCSIGFLRLKKKYSKNH